MNTFLCESKVLASDERSEDQETWTLTFNNGLTYGRVLFKVITLLSLYVYIFFSLHLAFIVHSCPMPGPWRLGQTCLLELVTRQPLPKPE